MLSCPVQAANTVETPGAQDRAASSPVRNPAAVIDKVSRLYGNGDYQAALDLISGEQWSNDATAAYWRGRIHQVRQEFDQARAAYRRAIALNPAYVDPHLALGNLAAEQGALDTAISELETAAQLAGNTLISADIRSRLREVYHRKSTTLYDGLPKRPELVDPAVVLGQKLVRANMLDEAQRLFERVLEQTQDNPQPYYWLGRIYLSKHQDGKGISAMERSVSLAPENPILRLELAKAYESLGRFENAEVEYRKVLQTRGTPPATIVETERRLQLIVARKEVLKGDVASALQRYQELLRKTPDDAGLLELYARALERMNHTAEADQVYDRLRKLLPDDPGLRLRLAEVFRLRDDVKRMRQAYVEAYKLARDPQTRQLALDGLGMRAGDELILKGDYKAANKIFFELDKDLPNNPDILMRKAKIYTKLGMDRRAIEVYDQILKLDPSRVDARLRRAEAQLLVGRDGKAIPELEKLARLGKDVPEARASADMLKGYYEKRARDLGERITKDASFSPAEVGEAIDLAQKLITVGMAASAKQILVPLTGRFPDARAFYWLGQVEINSGDRAKGLDYMEKSVELAPDNGRLFLSIGKLHEEASQWAEAESAYKRALNTVTDKVARREADKRLHLVQAQRLLIASKPEDALKLLDALAKRYPNEERILTLESEALLSSGRKEEATALLEKVVELSPRNVILRLKLASIYYKDKQYDKAELLYKQLLKLQPQNLSVHLALADLLRKEGRYVDAAEQVKEILKTESLGKNDRKNGEKLLNDIKKEMVSEGRKHLDNGELDQAQALFEGLLRIDPDQAPGHYWLAQVYKARKSFDDEVAALEKSLALAPDNLLLVPALANAYVEAGKLNEAADILNRLLEKQPFDFSSRDLLISVYDKLGQQDKGDEEARILLEQGAPEEIRATALDRLGMAAGRSLFKEEKYQEALVEYGKVLKIVPNEPSVNAEVARVYLALDNYDAAIAAYRTAIHEAPDRADYHIQLAKAYQKADNDEAAINEARLVTGMTVAKKWKAQARVILAAIQEREANRILDEEDIDKISDKGEGRLFPLMQRMLDDELYQSVKKIAEPVIAERPDLIRPYRLMARALIGLKRPTDAIVLLKQALVDHPGNTDIQLVLADAYREAKNETLAALVYEEILREDPSSAAVALELAELYHEQGDEGRARENYARVLTITRIPRLRKQALAGLGLYDIDRLIEQSQWQEASERVTTLVRLVPNVPEILLRRARILLGTKRIDQARDEYRRIIGMDANLTEARYSLGMILADEGRMDAAIKDLEVVARKVGDPYSRRAITRLGKIFGAKSQVMVSDLDSAVSLTPQLEASALDLIKELYLRLYYGHVKEISEALLKHGPNAQAFYWLGQAELKLGDRAKGVAAIEQSARLSSGNGMLLMKLAEVYESSGAMKKAEAAYRRVVALIPAGPVHDKATERMWVTHARVLDASGHIDAALKIYNRLLKRSPEDVQLLGLKGKALLALGRSDEADRVFERLEALEPNNVRLRLRMAQLYHEKGKEAQTLNHVKAIVALQPSGPEALAALTLIGFDKAVELQSKQDWTRALDAYNALLKIVPNNPMVLERVASIYQQTNDLSNLEDTLHTILAVEPRNGEALWRLSQLYLRTRRNDQAIAVLEDYLKTNRRGKYSKQVAKELADLYRSRVGALAKARKYDEAAMVLKKFARENPDNGRAFLQLGLFYAYSGDFEQAIQALLEAVRLLPDDPSAYHQLAVTYAQDSKAMEAVTAYAHEVALQEDPDKAMAVVKDLLFTMARKYYEEDQPIRAIRYLERLRGLGFKDSRIQNMLGFLLSQQGDYDQAIEVYREGIGINPDDLGMHFSLAGLYEQTNATAGAIAQLREILKRGKPGDRYVEAARQRKRYLEDKERRFTSYLGYTLVSGKSVLQEQDVNNTGAVNTSFSSSVNYRLTTTFHPSERSNIAIVTGLTHSANHSAQNDSIAPNISFNANLNSPKTFWGFSASYTESYGLLLDQFGGASANATLSNGIRFNHPVSEFLSLFDFSEDPLPDYFLGEDAAVPQVIPLEVKEEDRLKDYLTGARIPDMPNGPVGSEIRTFLLHVLSDLMHGHPAEALKRLNQDPYGVNGHDLALLLRGWLMERLGRPADATSAYLTLLERNSSNLWAKYSLGRLYQAAGESEAVNWLDAVYRATTAADGLHELSDLRLREVYLEGARALQDHEMKPADLTQFYGLIARLYDLGAYIDAMPLLERRVDEAGNDFDAHLWAGRYALALGHYSAAVDYLEDAVDLNDNSAVAHRALGDAYLAQGELDSADEAYGWVVEHTGDEQQRLYALEQLPFGINPDDLDAEDREKRKQELESYLQEHPQDPATLLQLGDLELLLGQNDEALAYYRKVGTLRPQDRYIAWRLVEAKPREGDGDKYRASLRSLMSLSSDHWFHLRVLRRLGLFSILELMADEDFDQAREQLEKVRELLSDDPLINLNLALVYRRLNENAKAKGILESMIESHPENLTALWMLGDLNVSLRSLDKGMTQLEQVVAQGGDTRVARLARERLQKLEEDRFALLTGTPEDSVASTKTFSTSLSMGKSFPLQSYLAQTRNASLNFSLSLPSVKWGTFTLAYTFSKKFNEDSLGTDYANHAQRLALSYNRPVPGVPKLTGGFTISHQQTDYEHYDTNALFALNQRTKRQIQNDALSANLRYELADKLSLSLAYSQSKTRSNLPVGIVYTPTGTRIAYQSLALGAFDTQSVNMSISFRF